MFCRSALRERVDYLFGGRAINPKPEAAAAAAAAAAAGTASAQQTTC